MDVIRFSALECHYGAREIFSQLDGALSDGERIGLVGPNGAGKSSLLRLLAGVDEPFGGSIVRARGITLGYLAQGVADETNATLRELVARALARAPDAEAQLRAKTLRIMLAAFGFGEEDMERPLRAFSGGQRAKAALAHLFIDEPDYLILDEPTNHLDIASVRWLEERIAGDTRGYCIVSHDRYFLDRVATRIWELERGRLATYAAASRAYTAFLAERDIRREEARREYERAMAEREKRRETIAGLRATLTSSNYSRVRSREKQLARIDSAVELEAPRAPRATIAVRLDASRRRGSGFAIEIEGLAKAYGERRLFASLTVEIARGERLAVVGPNGAGKSTLLKILNGELTADSGSVRYNPASRIAYFAQNSHEQIDPAMRAVDAVMTLGSTTNERARNLLGRMLLGGEAAEKPVHAFSGGERRRIMLACLMAQAADILLLDEPTNDLDIESRDALESVLDDYAGTIVVVSHDRYLLSRVCDRVLWIDGGDCGVIDDGYEAYEAQQRDRDRTRYDQSRSAERVKTSRQTPLKVRTQLANKVARVERDIAAADLRKSEIDARFATPELYDDRGEVARLEAERAALSARADALVTQWEALLLELEALDAEGGS